MDEVNEKLDKFIVLLEAYLENVPEEDKGYVGMSLCNYIIIDCTDSHLESMGFIECLKLDFQKQFDDMCAEEAKKKKRKKPPMKVVG